MRRTQLMPGIVVVGAHQVKGNAGRPEWENGRVAEHTLHWANPEAKKRCGGDKSKAKPGDLRPVPVYRGMDARFANEVRHDVLRKRRIALKQQLLGGPPIDQTVMTPDTGAVGPSE